MGGVLGSCAPVPQRRPANHGRIRTYAETGSCIRFGDDSFGTAGVAKADDFYRGKTLRLILPSDVGGGYDLYGRTFAPYLKKHIPGEPTVVVQNMPGGGGLLSVNWLYNVAPKDGLFVGLMQRGTPFYPYFGDKNAHFNPDRVQLARQLRGRSRLGFDLARIRRRAPSRTRSRTRS